MNDVLSVLNGHQTVSVTDGLWGDGGKGKFVNLFAEEWADIIARGTGGANAGHTVIHKGKTYALHLLPCGILYDGAGKLNVIGNGVAFDPGIASGELDMLEADGLPYNNLRISHRALLVLPQHLVIDRLREKAASGGIGSTGRGMGPVYTDRIARKGLTVNDLLNPDVFAAKLKKNLEASMPLIKQYDPSRVHAIMQHEHLANGTFWGGTEKLFNLDAIIEHYCAYAVRFRQFICDTDELMRGVVGKSRILLEGAQGLLLSVKYGTYPYVTPSDCSTEGLAEGVGLPVSAIDLALWVLKFLPTRVGLGPFPTEMGGSQSDAWCNNEETTRERELALYPDVSINDLASFMQGIALRRRANEYGATTGRPRRIGWPDAVMIRHAVRVMGPNVLITKPDVCSGLYKINVGLSYTYTGPTYHVGKRTINIGEEILNTHPDTDVLKSCEPLYKAFDGWQESIDHVRRYRDLPITLRNILRYLEQIGALQNRLVSVGPTSKETVLVN